MCRCGEDIYMPKHVTILIHIGRHASVSRNPGLVHATGTRQPFWPTERSTHFYSPGNHSSFTHLPPPSTRTQYNNSGSSSSPTTPNTPQAYYGLRYSTWWRLPLCSSLYSDSEICTRYILIEPPRDIRSVNSQIVKHYTNNPLKGNEWHYRQND